MRYTQPQAGPLTPNPEWAPQFLIAPNGGAISDAVLPSQVSTLYGGAAVSIAQTGAMLKLTGGTTYASLPSSNNYNILGEITLLWYGIIDDPTQYNFLLARFVGNGGDHNPFELRIDAGGVARLTRSGATSTPYFSAVTTSAIPSGVPVCLVVTSGADLSSGVSSFYVNGLPVSSSVTQYGNTGPALGNTEPLLLGTREDFYTYAKTRTALAAGFPNILPPAQIAAVSANPWQLFKATRRVLRVASGGGPSILGTIIDGADLLSSAVGPLDAVSGAKTDSSDRLVAQVAPVAAVTMARVDGADPFNAQVSPPIAGTTTVTDKSDPLVAALTSSTAMTSAMADGADALAAVVAALASGLNIDGAITDGIEPFAASLSTSVALMAGLIDSADLFLSATGPTGAVTVSRTDGSDALAVSAAPVAALGGSPTDSGDPLSIAAAPVVGVSVQIVDRADVFAGAAMPWTALSAALFDGADALSGAMQAVSATSASLSGAMTNGADIFGAIVQTIMFGAPLISTPTPRNWISSSPPRNWVSSSAPRNWIASKD